MGRQYIAEVHAGGEVYPLVRDVTHRHPEAVHRALGTSGEEELQHLLDQCHVDDWYDAELGHMGPDPSGLSMRWAEEG